MIFFYIFNIAIFFGIYELVGYIVFRFAKIAIFYHVAGIHNFSRAERPSGPAPSAEAPLRTRVNSRLPYSVEYGRK